MQLSPIGNSDTGRRQWCEHDNQFVVEVVQKRQGGGLGSAQEEVTMEGGQMINEHMGGGKGDGETIIVNYNKGVVVVFGDGIGGEVLACRKPSAQPRDAARREEC